MQDPDFRDVFNMIRSHSSFPMARLIDSFKKMEIGKLVYILRCLELKGLIELNKNTLRPSLITNFYEKAVYRMDAESWLNFIDLSIAFIDISSFLYGILLY